jgi:hypothetical protein
MPQQIETPSRHLASGVNAHAVVNGVTADSPSVELNSQNTDATATYHKSPNPPNSLNFSTPALSAKALSEIRAIEKKLAPLISGFTATALNHFDTDFDNHISRSEVKKVSKQEFRNITEPLGVDKKTSDTLWVNLNRLADLKAPLSQNASVFESPKGTDFASGMRSAGDPTDDAIKAASLTPRSEMRERLRSIEQKQPELTPILQSFENQKLMSAENMFFIQRLNEKHPESAVETLNTLNQWLTSPPSNHPGIAVSERKTFMNNVLRDMAFPDDIDQGEKGTCAATGIQMELARRDPKQYAQFATALANGEAYRLKDSAQGEVRRIYPNTTFRGDKTDDRSLSGKLLQNSMMETGHFAGENDTHAVINGNIRAYDSRASIDSAQGLDDKALLAQVSKKYPELRGQSPQVLSRLSDGLSEGEMEYLGQGFFGNQWRDAASDYHELRSEKGEDGKQIMVKRVADQEALFKRMDTALEQGKTLTIGSDDHVMLLTGKQKHNGRTVYQVSSWSGTYTMTQEALKQRLTNVFSDELPPATKN